MLLFVTLPGASIAQNKEPVSAGFPPAPATIRITFLGDILLEAHWKEPPAPAAVLWDGVRSRLIEADLVVVNLEEPLTDSNERTRHKDPHLVAAGRDFILRASSLAAARSLRDAGVGLASLANNHTMDYSERGMLDTLARLDGAGVAVVGGGEDFAAASRLRVMDVRGVRLGFLAFSDVVPPGYQAGEGRPGINSAKDAEHVRQSVLAAREQADVLAVIFHWGIEKARTPSARQRELARIAQQAGADMILGAHPHVLQGVGCVAATPVVYSAGNFVFPASRAAAKRTALFEIEVETPAGNARPRVAFLRLVPALIDEIGAPQLAEGSSGNVILNEMAARSHRLGASVHGDRLSCAAGQGKGETKHPARKKGN